MKARSRYANIGTVHQDEDDPQPQTWHLKMMLYFRHELQLMLVRAGFQDIPSPRGLPRRGTDQ